MKKHLTKAELQARKAAESGLEQGKRVRIDAPDWLGEEALKIFKSTRRRLKNYDLLELVDIDLLAIYADAVARYQAAVKALMVISSTEDIKTAQAWSRIAKTYADKLGFSQTARARLARKKAKAVETDELENFFDDVEDSLNDGEGG